MNCYTFVNINNSLYLIYNIHIYIFIQFYSNNKNIYLDMYCCKDVFVIII